MPATVTFWSSVRLVSLAPVSGMAKPTSPPMPWGSSLYEVPSTRFTPMVLLLKVSTAVTLASAPRRLLRSMVQLVRLPVSTPASAPTDQISVR